MIALIEAVTVLPAVLLGYVLGRAHRKAATATRRQELTDEYQCRSCGDNFGQHDSSGRCHALQKLEAEWIDRKPVRFRYQQCSCQRYVGDVPVDILSALMAPDTRPPRVVDENDPPQSSV